MTGQHACGAHDRLGADLRATARLLLDRLRTAVEPLRDGTPPEAGSPGECRACPVCAVLAVLRGERSELASQLAEHAAGLVTLLTAVLDAEGPDPTSAGPRRSGGRPDDGSAAAGHDGSGSRRPGAPGSGRIPVDRPGRRTPGATGTGTTGAAEPAGEPVWSGAPRHAHPRVPSTSGRSVQRIAVHRR